MEEKAGSGEGDAEGVSHRPLEVEGDTDESAGSHGMTIRGDDVAQGCPEGAGGLRGDHSLGVFEADPEEEAAGLSPLAEFLGVAGGEGMHLEFEDPRWLSLFGEKRELSVSATLGNPSSIGHLLPRPWVTPRVDKDKIRLVRG